MRSNLQSDQIDPAYSSVYAHLYQSLRAEVGVALLPFHSYDSVLPYMLALDAGVVSLDDKAHAK